MCCCVPFEITLTDHRPASADFAYIFVILSAITSTKVQLGVSSVIPILGPGNLLGAFGGFPRAWHAAQWGIDFINLSVIGSL